MRFICQSDALESCVHYYSNSRRFNSHPVCKCSKYMMHMMLIYERCWPLHDGQSKVKVESVKPPPCCHYLLLNYNITELIHWSQYRLNSLMSVSEQCFFPVMNVCLFRYSIIKYKRLNCNVVGSHNKKLWVMSGLATISIKKRL